MNKTYARSISPFSFSFTAELNDEDIDALYADKTDPDDTFFKMFGPNLPDIPEDMPDADVPGYLHMLGDLWQERLDSMAAAVNPKTGSEVDKPK